MPLPLEIVVQASAIRTRKFNEYLNEMPWSALTLVDRGRMRQLMNKFSVRGIPSLVLLDGQTESYHANGRQLVFMYGPDLRRPLDVLKKVNVLFNFRNLD